MQDVSWSMQEFHKKSGLCSWFRRPISNQPVGRIHKLFDLKIQIYHTLFLLFFFAGIVNLPLFAHCHYYSKMLIYLSHVFVSNHNSNMSTPWNSNDSVKKQWIWQLLQKKKKKNEYKRFEFSYQKVYGFGLQASLKLAFKINYIHKAWFFCD